MMPDTLSELSKKARYARAFMGRRLIHTNLQLLYQCNFACRICDFWRLPKDHPRLSLEQVRLISSKLNEIAPQIVSIGGGEPLLHPDLVPIVAALYRHHFPVMICNGWFVTEEKARALFDAGMYEISISVDYADPRKHDEQRGREGAFRQAVKALDTLNRNRRRPHQRVHMISVVMDDNMDEVEPLIRLCASLGITYLVTLYSDCRGAKDSRKIPQDISAHLLGLKKKYPEFVVLKDYVGRFSQSVREGGIGPCYAGKNLCNIDSTGKVSLCIDHVDDPVADILAEDMPAVEKKLLEKFLANTCKACWTSCRGSIESILYGTHFLSNLHDYYRMVRPVSLTAAAA